MAEEQEIKEKFEKFTSKFEETVFTLISKFNEIADGYSRVQEGLDFLGKIRIQTAENKQIMSKVEQSFKNLERKLRDMSADGFVIPEAISEETPKIGASDDLSSFLSAPATASASKSNKDDLSDLGDVSVLPSVDEIIKKEKPKMEKPVKDEVPEPIIPTTKEKPPKPQVPPAPITPPIPESKPLPITSPDLTPPSNEEIKIKEIIIKPPEPELTPVPKFDLKSSLTPTPKPPEPKSESIFPSVSKENMQDKGLPPKPATLGQLTPTPKFEQKQTTAPKAETANPITPPPVPQKQKNTVATDQRIQNINGIQDVWNNLTVDVKEAKNYEQFAVALGLANDYLKKFVKFHKVLFEILKIASEYRRKGSSEAVSKEEREHLLKIIEGWKFQLR